MKKKIVVLVNSDIVIYNFRLELLEALLAADYQVTVVSPYGERINFLTKIGCKFIELNLSRHGKNPFQDLKLLKSYKRILKAEKPDVVLTYTIKPNIYGGMACQSLKIPYIANVTGLGDAIENGGLLQKLTLFLYKKGLKKSKIVFFQNVSNQKFFLDKKIVRGKNDVLPGSGVNIERFGYVEYPAETSTNLLFIGRITRDKGVNDLAAAIKIITDKRQDVVFDIVGWADEGHENPFKELAYCRCHGSQVDVKPYLEKAHAIVLPSYHEGMANVLLEAGACGRPILASNIPGCQETFDEGVTGFGFEPKNVNSLCEAIERFIALPYEQKREMGKASRKKIEKMFNRQIVVEKYLEQINSL